MLMVGIWPRGCNEVPNSPRTLLYKCPIFFHCHQNTSAAMVINLKLLNLVSLCLLDLCRSVCGSSMASCWIIRVGAILPLPKSGCIVGPQLHGEQSEGNANPPSSPAPESFHTDMYTYSVLEPAWPSTYYPVSEQALPDRLQPEVAQTGKWFAVPGFPQFPSGFLFPLSFLVFPARGSWVFSWQSCYVMLNCCLLLFALSLSLSLSLCVCVCVYLYIYEKNVSKPPANFLSCHFNMVANLVQQGRSPL